MWIRGQQCHLYVMPGSSYCALHGRGTRDTERERFEEMLYAGEWPERAAPNLADLERSAARGKLG
jgi:hypothetical protein